MCSIRESREYQIGYSEGARDGWTKCFEGFSAMVEAARNPPQILIQCSNSADALRIVELGKSLNIQSDAIALVCELRRLNSYGDFPSWYNSNLERINAVVAQQRTGL